MFRKGEKIHLHDGTVHRMKKAGLPPRAAKSGMDETLPIRGFVRGALVGPDGIEHVGEWHENTVTTFGHSQIVRNFAGLAGSGPAKYWGIGNFTAAASAASDLSSLSSMHSEYGTNATQSVNSANSPRADVNASQAIAGVWTLSQSWVYPSSQISNNVVLNCLAQYASSAISTAANSTTPMASALSLAIFASSSKSNSQALNITYNWAFGT